MLMTSTRSVLKVLSCQSMEDGGLPISRATYAFYASHALLSVEIGSRCAAEETESVTYGHFDIELTEQKRMCAIECSLPKNSWGESQKLAPSLTKVGSASKQIILLGIEEQGEAQELRYIYDPQRSMFGVTAAIQQSRLLRVASGVLVELEDLDRISGIWIEDVEITT